jgi:hypothetical protein
MRDHFAIVDSKLTPLSDARAARVFSVFLGGPSCPCVGISAASKASYGNCNWKLSWLKTSVRAKPDLKSKEHSRDDTPPKEVPRLGRSALYDSGDFCNPLA